MVPSTKDPTLSLAVLPPASLAMTDRHVPFSPHPLVLPQPPSLQHPRQKTTLAPLSALLNPEPSSAPLLPPAGYLIGKDGRLKRKRGRKPTPGLTEEDRRQARLLKNRRTAETSRRRKLALMHCLTGERDEARRDAARLRNQNKHLARRLALALGISMERVLADASSEDYAKEVEELADQSEVSGQRGSVDMDSDVSAKKP